MGQMLHFETLIFTKALENKDGRIRDSKVEIITAEMKIILPVWGDEEVDVSEAEQK